MLTRRLCALILSVVTANVSAETFFVHADHLGTPQALTDASGAVVWRADYDPFGRATVDPSSTVEFNVRFPGQYFDAETGLHYNYYRDYDPDTGRYLQPDPIGLKGGVNTYTYADNNPLRFVDPLGLSTCAPDDEDCIRRCLEAFPYLKGIAPWVLSGLVNLKTLSEYRKGLSGPGGKSIWTSIDRRLPGIGNPNSGATVSRGTIGRIKYVGRVGTAAVAASAFSFGYGVSAMVQCIVDCEDGEYED